MRFGTLHLVVADRPDPGRFTISLCDSAQRGRVGNFVPQSEPILLRWFDFAPGVRVAAPVGDFAMAFRVERSCVGYARVIGLWLPMR